VEAIRTSGGERPVRHKIPLGILIFLVCKSVTNEKKNSVAGGSFVKQFSIVTEEH